MSGIIGTEPGQIPLNQFLSELAFMSREELFVLLAGAAGGVFSKSFVSEPQVVTNGGMLTIGHGLGKVPEFVTVLAQLKSAVSGYSVGDLFLVNPGIDNYGNASANFMGLSLQLTDTSLVVRFATAALSTTVSARTTTVAEIVRFSSCNLIFKAYA